MQEAIEDTRRCGIISEEQIDQAAHPALTASAFFVTRIYAKVDLPGLREVATFDLGGLI